MEEQKELKQESKSQIPLEMLVFSEAGTSALKKLITKKSAKISEKELTQKIEDARKTLETKINQSIETAVIEIENAFIKEVSSLENRLNALDTKNS